MLAKCEICGEIFNKIGRAKFCSEFCRQTAKRRAANRGVKKAKRDPHRGLRRVMSVNEVLAYGEAQARHLTYGKAVAKLERERGGPV